MAQVQAATELGCSTRKTTLTSTGWGGWLAEGCGKYVRLQCDDDDDGLFSSARCVRNGNVELTYEGQRRQAKPGQAFDDDAAASALEEAGQRASQSCRTATGPRGQGQAHVTFERGAVAGVVVDAPFAHTPAGDCVADKLQRVTIPPFDGMPVVVAAQFAL